MKASHGPGSGGKWQLFSATKMEKVSDLKNKPELESGRNKWRSPQKSYWDGTQSLIIRASTSAFLFLSSKETL